RRDWRGYAKVLGKMIERAQHRIGREAAQRAERAIFHRIAQIAQQRALRLDSRIDAIRRARIERLVEIAGSARSGRRDRTAPRVEPIRHGVHFPQLSTAQNSMAKRAMCAMSTVSSNTVIPAWPSSAPAAANAS